MVVVVVEKDLTEKQKKWSRRGGIEAADRGADRKTAELARVDKAAADVPLVELDRWVTLRWGLRPGLARLASELEEDRSRPAENKVMVRGTNGRQDGKEINQ